MASPANSFDPTDPDTLLWQVSGGNYRIVKDPIRLRPAFGRASTAIPDGLTQMAIRRARILAGVCPACLEDLPEHQAKDVVRKLGPFRWHCAFCGWRLAQTRRSVRDLLALPTILGLEIKPQTRAQPGTALRWWRQARDTTGPSQAGQDRLDQVCLVVGAVGHLIPWLVVGYLVLELLR